jgi:crotonobetainyl-CoA:carnitine CoA-transferase CaiB-like acyl-CoA transferase
MKRCTVLDFSRLLPGPYATRRLADLGMKVTCVEFPRLPEPSRTLSPALYAMLNRGKKRVKLEAEAPKLRRLLASADIVVEGFRPGVMDRLGLGYNAARKLNPKVVYCSLTGYDPDGPLGKKAGHDLNFLAMSGWLGLSKEPRMPVSPLADLAGSMEAVEGILAALLEGQGRHLKVSITDAAHRLLAIPLARWKDTGKDPAQEPQWWSGGEKFYGLYRTQDGGWLAVGAIEKRFAGALTAFLGTDDLEKAFASRTLAEWTQALQATDFCVTPVLSLPEAAAALSKRRAPKAR